MNGVKTMKRSLGLLLSALLVLTLLSGCRSMKDDAAGDSQTAVSTTASDTASEPEAPAEEAGTAPFTRTSEKAYTGAYHDEDATLTPASDLDPAMTVTVG